MKKASRNFLLSVLLCSLAIAGAYGATKLIDSSNNSSENQGEPQIALVMGGQTPHVLKAVGGTALLTATVTPADATDKTLVWASSNSSSVSVVSLSATTARITCLLDFDGSVSITVTATNGTSSISDDVSATCVCTFYHAVQSVDLQLWEVTRDGSGITGYVSQITNTTDLNISSTPVAFKVIVTPSNATVKTYTISSISGETIYGSSWAVSGYPLTTDVAFYLDATSGATAPNKPYVLRATSNDNGAITDMLTISVGNHLSYNDAYRDFDLDFSADNVPAHYSGDWDASSWDTAIEYETYKSVGTYARIMFPALGSIVSADYVVTASDFFGSTSSYFTIVDDGDNDLSNGATIIVQLTGATGATARGITISFTNYGASYNIRVPFLVSNPVTGVSLDNTTVTF